MQSPRALCGYAQVHYYDYSIQLLQLHSEYAAQPLGQVPTPCSASGSRAIILLFYSYSVYIIITAGSITLKTMRLQN